jgi:hypothetical protein
MDLCLFKCNNSEYSTIREAICFCDFIIHPTSTLLKYNKLISMIDFPLLCSNVCRRVTKFHIPYGQKMASGGGGAHKIKMYFFMFFIIIVYTLFHMIL